MRPRVTEVFPFLTPLRQWQRKKVFYLKMRFDGREYASKKSSTRLPYKIASMRSLLINENTGFDIVYQHNKVHNLQLAARTVNGLLIYPGQTFSFWQRVRHADAVTPYKAGLTVVNGKLTITQGGGLCQLSTLLYRLLSKTNMTLIERHSHSGETLTPAPDEAEMPQNSDATVSEGWLDLKFENVTHAIYQIDVTSDEQYLYGKVLSDTHEKEKVPEYTRELS